MFRGPGHGVQGESVERRGKGECLSLRGEPALGNPEKLARGDESSWSQRIQLQSCAGYSVAACLDISLSLSESVSFLRK